MNNLKTRIKRRKESPKKTHTEPSSTSVEADWQFVNFNPIFYGANRRGSLAAPIEFASAGGSIAVTGNPNNSEVSSNNRHSISSQHSSGGHSFEASEDFYEFPTSTKLNLCSPLASVDQTPSIQTATAIDTSPTSTCVKSGSTNSNTNTDNNLNKLSEDLAASEALEKEETNIQRRTKDLRDLLLETQLKNKYQRRSLNAAFDLLIPTEFTGLAAQGAVDESRDKSSHQEILRIKKGHSKSNPNPNSYNGRPCSGVGVLSLIAGGTPPPPPPPRPPGLIKSNSVLSSSSSSSITSSSASFTSCGGDGSSNPVSRSSSRGKESSSRSTFYVAPALPPKGSGGNNITLLKGPPPPPPPPYPLGGLSRPHSWDLDSRVGVTSGKSSRRLPFLQDVVDHHRKKKKSSFYHYGRKKDKLNISGGCGNDNVNDHPPPPLLKPKKYGAQIPINPSSLPMVVALSTGGGSNISSPLTLMTSANAHNNGIHHHPYGSKNNATVGNLCLNLSRISERQLANSGSSSSNLKGDRRPDTLSEERLTSDGHTFEDEDTDRVREEPKKPVSAVGRSESCKERVHRKQTRERRKHSDPNLTSKSSDVDLDNQRQLSDANNSGSSSNSSLSARYLTSLESPSTSLELVAPSNNSSSSLPGRNSETPETTVGHSGALPDSFKPSPGWDGDSDIEIEQDPPDWTKNVPEENLSRLDRLEKKRQEVLNELFHTERSHVRNLKVVDELFYRPIRHQQLLPLELIQMLFANLEEMLEIHGRFNSSFKKLRKESSLVGEIGVVLLEMFDGEEGDNFKRAAATFCSKQQIGLEILRERRRKDLKFHAFLQEAESHPVCRRLGIKDMIPMAMQRLTKYPLLFENLCNCTAADSEEYKNIQRAVDMSKEILCHVNSAKKEAEDLERLIEIQRKLDKSAFDKDRDAEIKNLDFTKHRLIHEGTLYWRMTKSSRQKSEQIEVQAVLLHDMIVILLKQDDRFVLKAHNMGIAKSAGNPAKPIIKLSNLHHRPVATDKRAFFLISTTTSNMYELVCSTPEERNSWFHHITKAADDYKNRQESRRSELHPVSNIPPSINAEPEDKNKDSAEGSGSGAEGLTTVGDSAVEQLNESPGRHSHDHNHPGSPKIIQKEASPAPDSTSSEPPPTLSPDKSGDGKLMVGSKVGRSVSASPSAPRRIKQGEFLKVTESSPLVEPSEVVVVTRDVQFAQSVLSPYEELKRADLAVQKALEEKMRLASKLFNIPVENQSSSGSSGSADVTVEPVPKDAKEMIAACMKNVDKLIGIVSSQKITKENIETQKEQQNVHGHLSALLTQIMSEYERKEEELELRRQELHRIREQNHGYQERLQSKANSAKRNPSSTSGGLSSPTLSPPHSRPSSFLSSSSDPHPEEEQEVVMKAPLKPQLSDPVATSSSNLTNSSTTTKDNTQQFHDSSTPAERLERQRSSSDLAQDEFADAAGVVGFASTDDLSSGVETNRESTETEVVMSTTDSSSNSSSETIIVDTSVHETHETGKDNNGLAVPELGAIGPVGGILNGHSSSGDSAMSSGDENCNKDASSTAAVVESSSVKNTGNIVGALENLTVDKESNNGN